MKTNKTFIKKQRKKIKNQKNKYKKKDQGVLFGGVKRKEKKTELL